MRKVLLIGLLFVLSACTSSHAKQIKALRTIQSWAATAHMVGETWQQGTVPDVYTQQTLSKSQQEISKEAEQLTAVPVLKQQLGYFWQRDYRLRWEKVRGSQQSVNEEARIVETSP